MAEQAAAKFDWGKGVFDLANAGVTGLFQYKAAKEQADAVQNFPVASSGGGKKSKANMQTTLLVVGGAAVALVLVVSLTMRK